MRSLISFLPQRGDYAGLASSWRQDCIAGVTVGVAELDALPALKAEAAHRIGAVEAANVDFKQQFAQLRSSGRPAT